jgi:cyclohexa-1,5-dienecarbonyl-CoA hydratase
LSRVFGSILLRAAFFSEMTNDRSTVRTRIEGRAAWIILDQPPLNIFNIDMMRQLDAALERTLPKSDFVVFQGHGPKGFSAGAEIADHLPERIHEMLTAFHSIFRRLSRTECVTIAAVHGHCLGGGMELATFCDFVIATPSAEFAQPEIKLACFPPIAMITLPHLCGFRAAMDLILTGRTILAEEARDIGLVSRIASDGELKLGVNQLLAELGKLSPKVLGLTRRTLWRLRADEFERQLSEIEQIYLDELMPTEDAREGVRAFLEKRGAVWRARRADLTESA